MMLTFAWQHTFATPHVVDEVHVEVDEGRSFLWRDHDAAQQEA